MTIFNYTIEYDTYDQDGFFGEGTAEMDGHFDKAAFASPPEWRRCYQRREMCRRLTAWAGPRRLHRRRKENFKSKNVGAE